MLVDRFFEKVLERIERIRGTQAPSIQAAARVIVDTMTARRRTFVFGSGHSNLLTQEICARAGELPIYNPIFIAGLLPTDYPYLRSGLMERVSGIAAAALDSISLNRGDNMIVISNSGRNHVPVEMAMEARKREVHVVALTSVEFSTQVNSRHPSGKKLYEVADIVIDNCCPPGDGVVAVPDSPACIGPLSTILGAVALHSLSCTVSELLSQRGTTPPVFISGNVDGAEEYTRRILESYKELMTYGW